MVEKQTGFCPELLICPGETLEEVLTDRNMSRKELAIRSGVTEKHICKIINGKASITASFAAALESALHIDAEFWLNLQSNYDLERIACYRSETVTEEELDIAKHLNEIRKYLAKVKLIPDLKDKKEIVLALRDYAHVTNLNSLTNLQHCAAYRISTCNKIDPYVLLIWQKLCEDIAAMHRSSNSLNKEKLLNSIPEIRNLMLADANTAITKLQGILNECGITFALVKNFTGAPVQGYIEKSDDGSLALCMTLRNSFADIFWFTLFHEIAHILYDDTTRIYLDYTFERNEIEDRADQFASNTILANDVYQTFVSKADFSYSSISTLSQQENIPPFMIIGRLQKDGYIPYTWYSDKKPRYKWRS